MKNILSVLLVSLILLSCSDEGDLPISTTLWKPDGNGFIQFSTNDPNVYFYEFFTIFTNDGNQNIYEIECKKMSGDRNGPYGMIFGASNTNMNSFYVLLIDTEGYYSIWKRINNNDTELKEWLKSERLFTGYGTTNNLKVVRSSTTFTVFINDHQVHQFIDSDINGNRIGFYVTVGTEEDESFPNNLVDVRFREK